MTSDKQAVTRETLYEEVWREPVSKVAPRYDMSDVGLAKLCRGLQIPLPQRGHWAKLKAGKKVVRPPLRKLDDDDAPVAYLAKMGDEALAARASAKRQASALRRQVRDSMSDESPADGKRHSLVEAAGKRLRRTDGWKGEKGLRSVPAEVLHIEVTPSSLDRALALMNTLLHELEKQDICARIDRENKCTILDVRDTPIQLMLSEHIRRTDHEITDAEKVAQERYYSRTRTGLSAPFPHIPRYDFHPTGAFTLTADRWLGRTWRDTKRTQLEQRLGEIVAGLLQLANDIARRKKTRYGRRKPDAWRRRTMPHGSSAGTTNAPSSSSSRPKPTTSNAPAACAPTPTPSKPPHAMQTICRKNCRNGSPGRAPKPTGWTPPLPSRMSSWMLLSRRSRVSGGDLPMHGKPHTPSCRCGTIPDGTAWRVAPTSGSIRTLPSSLGIQQSR